MKRTAAIAALLLPALLHADIVAEVRAAIARRSFDDGEQLIAQYRAKEGVTPEMTEALSWLGRGALAARQYDRADSYAAQTRKLVADQLERRKLDAEKHLPLALGASIEVHAFVLDARGERGEAIRFLRGELAKYRDTSIRTRIQKNINLLSLEGKPAPALEVRQWLGPKPLPLDQLKGHPVILFFWAHWCGDCKGQAPDLGRITAEYAAKGLVVVGPTQRYGYVAGGRDATPEEETPYIDSVRKQYYSMLARMPVPVSEENFKLYGASTTPTLVFLNHAGIVQVYHPGAMSPAELEAATRRIVTP